MSVFSVQTLKVEKYKTNIYQWSTMSCLHASSDLNTCVYMLSRHDSAASKLYFSGGDTPQKSAISQKQVE